MRHHHVEHGQLELARTRQPDAIVAVVRDLYDEAVLCQVVAQQVGQFDIVIDQKQVVHQGSPRWRLRTVPETVSGDPASLPRFTRSWFVVAGGH